MLELASAQQLIGGAVLLGLSLVFERHVPAHADSLGAWAFVYLVVVASVGAHTVQIWLASRTNATFATPWTYVSPFIALLIGAIALREPIGAVAWLGCVCVVAAAIAHNWDLTRAMPFERGPSGPRDARS